ncbi:hypothetical protein V8F20_011294 [Naviculisporaceae sp. PSN 640]
MASGQSNVALALAGSPAKAERPTSVRITSQFSSSGRKIPANVEVIVIESDDEEVVEISAAAVAPAVPAAPASAPLAKGSTSASKEAEPTFFLPPMPYHICDESCYEVGSRHYNGNYIDRHYDADHGLIDYDKIEAEHEEIGRLYEIYVKNLDKINSLLPADRQLSDGPYSTIPREGLEILRLVAEHGLDALRMYRSPREANSVTARRRTSDTYRGRNKTKWTREEPAIEWEERDRDSEDPVALTPKAGKSSPKRKARHLPREKCPNVYDTTRKDDSDVEYIANRVFLAAKRRRFNDNVARRSRGGLSGSIQAAMGSPERDLADFTITPVIVID